MRRWLSALILFGLVAGEAGAAKPMRILTRIGPWPILSKPIFYDGRLWAVNSVLGRNHNSADIYSVDLMSGRPRYERHLISQDAGDPVIADGLLYWPYEDPRTSVGWGLIAVTDGRDWRRLLIPTARIFHIHAMAAANGRLIAATSAWRAGVAVSDDSGRTWRTLYDHPTPARQVSRIVSLVAVGDRAYGEIKAPDGRRLLMIDGTDVGPAPGWPTGQPTLAMVAFAGRLLGLVREDGGVAVWATDGVGSTRLAAPVHERNLFALATDGAALWAVGGGDGNWRLWRSSDGRAWSSTHDLAGGTPYAIAVGDGHLLVTGAGDDGKGIVWHAAIARSHATPRKPRGRLPLHRRGDTAAVDWTNAAKDLRKALADPATYQEHGRGLRDRIQALVSQTPPTAFFSDLLHAPMPQSELSLIGGNVVVPAQTLGRWLLLWGMRQSGQGRVPVTWLQAPWTAPANSSEKYFDTAMAAIWTVAAVAEDDSATIDALINRLGRAGDPDWLTGDIVGALSQLTGQRFAYDIAEWQAWWRRAEMTWRGKP